MTCIYATRSLISFDKFNYPAMAARNFLLIARVVGRKFRRNETYSRWSAIEWKKKNEKENVRFFVVCSGRTSVIRWKAILDGRNWTTCINDRDRRSLVCLKKSIYFCVSVVWEIFFWICSAVVVGEFIYFSARLLRFKRIDFE